MTYTELFEAGVQAQLTAARETAPEAARTVFDARLEFWAGLAAARQGTFGAIECETTRHAAASVVCASEPDEPGELVLTLNGELFGVNPDWAGWINRAKTVRFHIGTAPGGELRTVANLLILAGPKCVGAHCETLAASAAAVLLSLSPGRRTANARARLMLHKTTTLAIGGEKELAEALENVRLADREVHRKLVQATGQPPDVVASWQSGPDRWFTAPEAQALGLIDEVL